ncbi:hypothetical protein [Aquisediminimonas sediminicola]|uniref:hypothetical protein n=1 Tax=Alteraquisediminimonas sediminicola TaxID=2676787 RepID=UPI001C8D3BDA|nr:hypothetical protein [Aquisediminimonas sediminicola]
MTTYTWQFGAEGSGVYFSIVYDSETGNFTVNSFEGSFDLNALWFSNGDKTVDGDTTLVKSDSSLNMNGSNTVWDDEGNATSEKVVWDDYLKVSSTGLGSAGEAKTSFVSEGESYTFSAGDFDPEEFGTLGVRATSVNGGDGLKWVDSAPVISTNNPWGDNPFSINLSGGQLLSGAAGVAGVDGSPGGAGTTSVAGTDGTDGSAVGDGTDGTNATATGSPPVRVAATDGTDGAAGIDGTDGGDATAGGDGQNGTDGQAGGDGDTAMVADALDGNDQGYTAILINSIGSATNSIYGGDGGAGGDGGDGGAGSDGADGGAGGDGSDGGDGGDGGNGIGSGGTVYQSSGDGGDGGVGGDGGDGGDSGAGGDGGDGGVGGDGGDAGHAIQNGDLSDVFIIGNTDLVILGGLIGTGGDGGDGGDAGIGGTAGDGGDAGIGGTGGDAGTKVGSGTSGTDGADGVDGTNGDVGVVGADGVAGTDGADGSGGDAYLLRAAAFSDSVDVDASAFTGQLTISGSDFDDSFIFGTGGTIAYATLGSDDYVFSAEGAADETIIYTAADQSSGGSIDSIDNFDLLHDKIDVSSITESDWDYAWDNSSKSLTIDLDGDASADMAITLLGINTTDINDFALAFA